MDSGISRRAPRLNQQHMPTSHADYWEQANGRAVLEKWARHSRRRILAWKLTLRFSLGLKRAIDVVCSFCALLALGPAFLIIAAMIRLEDGGSIFFRQSRVGQCGRRFGMWKFRSMVPNADQVKDDLLTENQHGDGVTFKMKEDPRITRIGKFLRMTSLDELPQFYNVLRGDMSLVGPRPPVPKEVERYSASHLRRLRVKPGITCIWQVSGRSNINFEGQVRLDLEYIRSAGLATDVLILLKTIPAVVLGKGAY